MSDWRDRVLNGIYVPADKTEAIVNMQGAIGSLLKHAGIEWVERVHGANTRVYDFVAAVDESGRDKGLRLNPRARDIIGYPGPIFGNVILFSEAMMDGGIDFVDIDPGVKYWIDDVAF